MMPESFEYANNGGRKYLLRNKGDGTFEDVTEKIGINSTRWTLAVAAADLRGTGYPDLFLANDYGVSEFVRQPATASVREIGKRRGVGATPKSGMNVSFGDVFNQGQFAIYVTNITEPGVLIAGEQPLGAARRRRPARRRTTTNLANALGVELGGWSWGAQFGDLNNDGLLDLYLTNGYVSADATGTTTGTITRGSPAATRSSSATPRTGRR